VGIPSLFMHVTDPVIERELMQLKSLHQFVLTKSSHIEHWIKQLEMVKSDVALVEVDNFSSADAEQLIASHLLSDVDFIFISSGIPNPDIDGIMARGGGFHYRKPLKFNRLEETLDDIFDQLNESSHTSSTAVASELDQFGLLVGSSKPMRKLYRIIRRVALTEANVLITGESGAGKELVAKTIHLSSGRLDNPFVALNCGAISTELAESELFGHLKGSFTGAHKDHAGVFEQAEGGTLFLDEVTEMLPENQVKLLRVLETGEYRPVGAVGSKQVNVRVICATNRDPLEAIAEGIFREDLYFRLAHFPIHLPPLRDRGNDILGLARHFLAYLNVDDDKQKLFSDEASEQISEYEWPGNVRELKHVIEKAYILAEDIITPEHLDLHSIKSTSDVQIPAGLSLDDLEKAAILQTLQNNEGNKTDTAKQLGISVKTLYNKLEKYVQKEEDAKVK